MNIRDKYKEDKDVLRLIENLKNDGKTDEDIKELLEDMEKTILNIRKRLEDWDAGILKR